MPSSFQSTILPTSSASDIVEQEALVVSGSSRSSPELFFKMEVRVADYPPRSGKAERHCAGGVLESGSTVLPEARESRAHARLHGSCFGLRDRLAACSSADPLYLRSKHVESRPRSTPEQCIRKGDGAHHLRRSPRHGLTRLPQGETLKKTTRLAIGAGPPRFVRSPLHTR